MDTVYYDHFFILDTVKVIKFLVSWTQ